MRGSIKLLFCAIAAIAIGCGSADEPPKPLSAHYDDMYIASVPLDQKQAMIQAQQDWNVARMQNANATSQEQDAETQLHQAHNDQKAAQLAIDSASSNKKSADLSNDMNRINQAAKELNTARDLAKAAGARVSYIEAYVRYLRKYVRWSQENMYFREAQFENAKAQIGQHNNIAPRGVVYANYPKQMQDRERRTSTAKSNYDGMRSATENARANWLKLQTLADSENGRAGTYWDPLAPKPGAAATAP